MHKVIGYVLGRCELGNNVLLISAFPIANYVSAI